ncbi:MAG: sensor histidine kinase/response regulator [Bryobacterales bacterium]|jgi:two-component system, sensor histidine kinase and response regulator|nr:sensor histidine kinase/response regulator [Bryobacterales bacterium]
MAAATILNVDDYEPGRYARSRLLKQAGYLAYEAGSGGEALKLAEAHSPDLILLDVNLPDIHGFEVCRQLKSGPVTSKTPVIQISATNISTAARVAGLDNGADGYLVSPVDPDVLLATIRALLRVRKAEAELEHANSALLAANAALAVANDSLTRSNEDLQKFAYLASHDLQEPLRTVSSFATLLQRRYAGKLDEDADEMLRHIRQGTNRMSSLIQGLLAYAQAGRETDEPLEEVDIESVLTWALNNLENSVAESQARITRDPLPSVRGDHMQLAQLFQNLISNGIKYCCPTRPPEIHLSASPNKDRHLFLVRDNGMGIAPEFHQQVFAPFRRLHGQDVPGTGIGLATCQRIVERHGGRIWVESEPGEGSTFLFTLPAA